MERTIRRATTFNESQPVRNRTTRFPKLAVWPIHNEADYERTRAVVDKLILTEKPAPEQEAQLKVMLTLMEAWEAVQHRIDTAGITPIDILKSLMEDHGMNASDLGCLLGSRSLGSAILRGTRQLSKMHVQILCDRFKLGPAAFM